MTRQDRKRRARRLRRKRFLCLTTALVVLLTATVLLSGAAHTGGEGEAEAPQVTGDDGSKLDTDTVELNQGQAVIATVAIMPEALDTEGPKDGPDEGKGEADAEGPAEEDRAIQALLSQGYISDEIPLSYEEQIYLRAACEESGTPFALALAVIQKETHFQNLIGDSGNSFGYMQVQQKWHHDRMERLGVTDLMDPFSNFRVGCDILSELLGKYELKEALTAYNSGHVGHNEYSDVVVGYYEDWMEVLEWE